MNVDPLLNNRIDAFKQIMLYGNVRNATESCLDQVRKRVTDNIVVQKRIGSSSVNGEAYLGDIYACPVSNKFCSPNDISVKLVPLKADEIPYIRNHATNPKAWTKTLWAELLFMQICSFVVKMFKIPNLPMAYAYMFCNSCKFQNESLQQLLPRNNPCLLLLNEFAHGGDLATWCKTPHDLREWSVAYFQIFTALYFLQKFFNITHHDMHWGNVLVHPAPRGGYSMYLIDGKKYYIPNLGYCFVLWDFGYARIPGKVEIENLQEYYTNPIHGQAPRLLVDYFRIAQAPLWMRIEESYRNVDIPFELESQFLQPIRELFHQGYTLKKVIPQLWGMYTQKPETGIVIERYDLDSPFKNFPTEHAFLLHDFIKEPIPDRVPTNEDYAMNAEDIYSKYGSSHMVIDQNGNLELQEERDYKYYDPMDIDE